MIMADGKTGDGCDRGQEKCNHPDHKKILEKYSMEEENIENFIDTPKYGKICVVCWSYETGKHIERHPVSSRDP